MRALSTRSSPGALRNPHAIGWLLRSSIAAYLWLPVRLYVGWQWLRAGEEKLTGTSSVGWIHTGMANGKPVHAGDKLLGFWKHAVAPPQPGTMSQVGFGWYRDFLRLLIDNHTQVWFAHLIAWGELLVGVALILGAFTAVAAGVGALLNFNYMLAGSASLNPVLFLGALLLMAAWRVAGMVGVDHWLLPLFGTPWQPGRVLRQTTVREPVDERSRRSRGGHATARPPRHALFVRRRRIA